MGIPGQSRAIAGAVAVHGRASADEALSAALGALQTFGIGTALVGTAPREGATVWRWQASSDIVLTNGSGVGTVTFPKSFPGGVLAVAAWGNGAIALAAVRLTTSSIGGFTFAGTAATTYTVSYIAVGW